MLMLPHAAKNSVNAEAIPKLATVRTLPDLTMVSPPNKFAAASVPQPSAKPLSEQ
jgi:hypothetical protein